MVRTDIKISPPKPFVWYQEYHYFGTDPESYHIHPIWQLTIAGAGELRFSFSDGTSHLLHAGSLLLIAPGTLHEGHCSGTHAHSMQLFFRYFDPETMPEISRLINSTQMDAAWVAYAPPERCLALANDIRKNCRPSAPLCRCWMHPLISSLFLEGITPFLNQFQGNDFHLPSNIEKVFFFLQNHFQSNISVKELAEMADLSPSRFSFVFQHYLQMSPIRFLNRLRITFAQELLLNHVSVGETAYRAGFSSPQYFCRYFHKEMGQTPLEFTIAPNIKRVL